MTEDRRTSFKESQAEHTCSRRYSADKVIKSEPIGQRCQSKPVVQTGDHRGQRRLNKKLRNQSNKYLPRRQQNRGNVENVGFPTFVGKNIASDRISDKKMEEERNKESECKAVDQVDREIKILARADRPVNMKDERREANHREMQHERRAAALLE